MPRSSRTAKSSLKPPPPLLDALNALVAAWDAVAVALPGDDGLLAASEEVSRLYYADGDPTCGYRSQNSRLLTDPFAATFELEGADGGVIQVAQQGDQLRRAGVTGCVVWSGAVALAKTLVWWDSLRVLDLSGRRVLELGAGTGALAIAVSMLGAHVVATEQADRLKLLRRNVEAHRHGSSSARCVGLRGGRIDVEELDWFSVPRAVIESDLLMATDVVFTEEVTRAFVDVVAAYKIPCLVCLELRSEEVHFDFVDALVRRCIRAWRLPAGAHAPDARARQIVMYFLSPEPVSLSSVC